VSNDLEQSSSLLHKFAVGLASETALWIGMPHAPGLVLLSVVIAICGGYVGLGLAAQASSAFGLYRRGLLAGAAWSLGLSIWTMHFVGMLAARLPEGTLYSYCSLSCHSSFA
jgi:NO-binding membrane sensor protein with MHYT domain